MNGGSMKAASQGAIAALAGLLLSAGSAQAADLGGNCCADLEERVAELEATTVRKGNRRVSLTLSGQVNRSLLYWNDGFQDDVYSVDNAIANSRFRMTGNAKLSANVTVGFYTEFSLALGARSHQVNQIDDDGFTGQAASWAAPRWATASAAPANSVHRFQPGQLVRRQQALGPADRRPPGQRHRRHRRDRSQQHRRRRQQPALPVGRRHSPAQRRRLACRPDLGADVRRPDGGAAFTGAPVPYSTDCGIHALTRRDAVMYTSPTWHGFTFSGAFGEDDFWDVAGRYAGEWHGFRVAAGARLPLVRRP